MSALQAQLSRLAAGRPDALGVPGRQSHPSFLFDVRTAADMDMDTVYALGINGLSELMALDERFAPYEKSLFALTTKDVDRQFQTDDVNSKMTEAINSFLALLSGFFTLKPAHKALEYLVRRYRVHELNMEAVIACVLPYHDTKQFGRLVQLLPVKETSWHFLEGLKKGGLPLKRETLVTNILKDLSLLDFIATFTKSAADNSTLSRAGATFYAITVVTVLNTGPAVNERVLQRVLPSLLTALTAASQRDYQLCGYMILAQLASRTTLTPEANTELINALVKYADMDMPREALSCLAYVCQAQRGATLISNAAFNYIAKFQSLALALQQVRVGQEISRLLGMLLEHLGTHSLEKQNYKTLLMDIIREVSDFESCASGMADKMLRRYADPEFVTEEDFFLDILKAIQQRYPVALDSALASFLASVEDDADAKARVQECVNRVLTGGRHEVLEDVGQTLYSALNHTSATVRMLGLDRLATHMADKETREASGLDDEFIRRAVLDRLADEDAAVAKKALGLPQLVGTVPSELLMDKMEHILKSGGRDATAKALRVMCGPLVADTPSLLPRILRLTLGNVLLGNGSRKTTWAAIKGLGKLPHALGDAFAEVAALQDADEEAPAATVNAAVISKLAVNIAANNGALAAEAAVMATAGGDAAAVLIMALDEAVGTSGASIEVHRAVLPLLRRELGPYARAAKKEISAAEKLPHAQLVSSTKGVAYGAFLATMLEHAISTLPHEAELQRDVFAICTSVGSEKGNLAAPLRAFVREHLAGDALSFFAGILSEGTAAPIVQLGALRLAHGLLQQPAKPKAADPTETILPALLVALQSSHQAVREAAVATVVHLASRAEAAPAATPSKGKAAAAATTSVPLARLVRDLSAMQHELAQDASYITSFLRDRTNADLDGAWPRAESDAIVGWIVAQTTSAPAHAAAALLAAVSRVALPVRLERSLPLLKSELAAATGFIAMGKNINGVRCAVPSAYGEHARVVSLLLQQYSVLEVSLPLLTGAGASTTTTSMAAPPKTPSKLKKGAAAAAAAAAAAPSEADAYSVLIESLTHPLVVGNEGAEPTFVLRLEALKQITPEAYTALAPAGQLGLLRTLCTIIGNDKRAPKVLAEAQDLFGRLPVHASTIELLLDEFMPAKGSDTASEERNPKRARKGDDTASAGAVAEPTATNAAEVASIAAKLLGATILLEVLQYKNDLVERERLIGPLFELIQSIRVSESKGLLDAREEGVGLEDFGGEYAKQLALAVLLSITRDLASRHEAERREAAAADLSAARAAATPSTGKRKRKALVEEVDEMSPALREIEKLYDVDLVVECIRSGTNPQTHSAALLLMAGLAALFPKRILHNVMPVFTFMGAAGRFSRVDDNYTFQVIQKTIAEVIPPLLAHGLGFQPLLQVFVDALPHIPHHRRLHLFVGLCRAVGEDYLHLFLLSLFARHVISNAAAPRPGEERRTTDAAAALSIPEFAASLCAEFSVFAQVRGATMLIDDVNQLPNDDSEREAQGTRDGAVDVAGLPRDAVRLYYDAQAHDGNTTRRVKYAAVAFVGGLLTSDDLLRGVVALPVEGEGAAQAEFQKLFSALVGFLRGAADAEDKATAEKNHSSTRFWQGTLRTATDALDRLNDLLSVPGFIAAISDLLRSSDAKIRRRALQLFNDKVARHRGLFTPDQRALFVGMVEQLREIVVADTKSGGAAAAAGGDAMVTGDTISVQTALESLDILARHFCADSQDVFLGTVTAVLAAAGRRAQTSEVVASGVLCLGALTAELKHGMLPHLTVLVPLVLRVLESSIAEGEVEHRNTLQQASLACIQTLVAVVPMFLSPHLASMLACLLRPPLVRSAAGDVRTRLEGALSSAAAKVSARLMVPAIVAAYPQIVSHGEASLTRLFALVKEVIVAMDRPSVESQTSHLYDFLTRAFDLPTEPGAVELPTEVLERIEVESAGALVALVMRLNEKTFKPLFLRLIDWSTARVPATEGKKKKGAANKVSTAIHRVRVFHHSVLLMAEGLKSIFVPYFGHLLDAEVSALSLDGLADETAENVAARRMTITHVVDGLRRCFLYDNEGFIDRGKFEKIMNPLVELLSLPTDTSEARSFYRSFVENYLAPTLGQLAVTLGNDALWKPLNHTVLLKTRSPTALERFGALCVVEEFYTRVGRDFCLVLPESIPFISELMEDSDAMVEQLCHQVVKKIEACMGESIKKYF